MKMTIHLHVCSFDVDQSGEVKELMFSQTLLAHFIQIHSQVDAKRGRRFTGRRCHVVRKSIQLDFGQAVL